MFVSLSFELFRRKHVLRRGNLRLQGFELLVGGFVHRAVGLCDRKHRRRWAGRVRRQEGERQSLRSFLRHCVTKAAFKWFLSHDLDITDFVPVPWFLSQFLDPDISVRTTFVNLSFFWLRTILRMADSPEKIKSGSRNQIYWSQADPPNHQTNITALFKG